MDDTSSNQTKLDIKQIVCSVCVHPVSLKTENGIASTAHNSYYKMICYRPATAAIILSVTLITFKIIY